MSKGSVGEGTSGSAGGSCSGPGSRQMAVFMHRQCSPALKTICDKEGMYSSNPGFINQNSNSLEL